MDSHFSRREVTSAAAFQHLGECVHHLGTLRGSLPSSELIGIDKLIGVDDAGPARRTTCASVVCPHAAVPTARGADQRRAGLAVNCALPVRPRHQSIAFFTTAECWRCIPA